MHPVSAFAAPAHPMTSQTAPLVEPHPHEPVPSEQRDEGAPLIVDAAWLDANLDQVIVIDTRRPSEYFAERIPGSLNLSLAALLLEDTGPTAFDELARATIGALARQGIGLGDHVVFVDDGDGSASFGVFLAELAGLSRVSALHGGLRSWIATTDTPISRGTDSGGSAREAVAAVAPTSACAHVAGITDLISASQTGSDILIDARSQLEHEGIVGSPCCEGRGHIPGSAHLEWTAILAPTGMLASTERIQTELARVGARPQSKIIVYCHTNPRGALLALAIRNAGFTSVRLALGGVHEWSGRGLPMMPEAD